jgi:hypothetical protein
LDSFEAQKPIDMKLRLFSVPVLGLFLLLLAGCYPAGPEYTDEYDIVFTAYDDATDFKTKKFYAIPDEVVEIDGTYDPATGPDFIDPAYSALIINRIKSNMASYGYTLVADTGQADVIILPGALQVTNVTYTYWYDYWGYYYGYGWYYPYPTVTTYTTGSLIMTMIDRKNLNPSNNARVVWSGIVNGLLEGASSDFGSRINKGIDQAFRQSPYLAH